jgi:hypothetical protein
MSLKKYLFIVLFVFMQFMPIDAKNEIDEIDMQDQIEEYNDDDKYNDNIKYLVLTAGIVAAGGLAYWYQYPLANMAMQLFGDRINEKGQVVITSEKAIAIMNKNQSLQNVNYGLKGPVLIEGGKIKSGTLIDGSYFTASGVNYVVEN